MRLNPIFDLVPTEKLEKLIKNNRKYFVYTTIWLVVSTVLSFGFLALCSYPDVITNGLTMIFGMHTLYVIAVAFLIKLQSKQMKSVIKQRGATKNEQTGVEA